MQTAQKNSIQRYIKRAILVAYVLLFVVHTPVVADALKNSLTNILNNKSSTGMVNLDNFSINGKTKTQTDFKSRPANTIIATIKGYKIRKKEADDFLNRVTKGKVRDYDRIPKKQRKLVIKELVRLHELKNKKSRPPTAVIATVNGVGIVKKEADIFLQKMTAGKVKDFDKLSKKQQKLLISDLARPIVVKQEANKSLTTIEKEGILKQFWLEKQKKNITVSNDEMLALYEEKKKEALAVNPNAVIPGYLTIGNQLRSELVERKITQRLMRGAKIEINYDANESSLAQKKSILK